MVEVGGGKVEVEVVTPFIPPVNPIELQSSCFTCILNECCDGCIIEFLSEKNLNLNSVSGKKKYRTSPEGRDPHILIPLKSRKSLLQSEGLTCAGSMEKVLKVTSSLQILELSFLIKYMQSELGG